MNRPIQADGLPNLLFQLEKTSNDWSVVQIEYPILKIEPFTPKGWKADSNILVVAALFALLEIRKRSDTAPQISAHNSEWECQLNKTFRSLWNEHRKNADNFRAAKKNEESGEEKQTPKSKWFITLFDPWTPHDQETIGVDEKCGVEFFLNRKGEAASGLISHSQGFHKNQVGFGLKREPLSFLELSQFVQYVLREKFQKKFEISEEEIVYGSKQPGNLAPPSLGKGFIGRARDVSRIKAFLTRPGLLILTGPFFVGKTRLALEVRDYYLRARVFPHGVFFVDLREIGNAALIAPAMLNVLGESEQPNVAAIDILKASLCNKTLLLIFDNCESHPDECAKIADVLIRSCSDLRILATSNYALPVTVQCRTIPVDPLEVPVRDKLLSVTALSRIGSVKLFMAAAKSAAERVRTEFNIKESNAPAIAELCRRLDGLPGSIELMAPLVRVRSVEEILKELPQLPNADAAIEFSYRLLDEPARILFRRTSVFAGKWSREEAERICGDSGIIGGYKLTIDQIEASLRRLQEASLVKVDTTGSTALMNYLNQVQVFARRKLTESGEEKCIFDRYLSFFASLAECADNYLKSAESLQWMERLQGKLPDIRAALDWALNNSRVEDASRIAVGLRWFWIWQGHFSEANILFAQVIKKSEAYQPLLRASIFDAAGLVALFGGKDAIEFFSEGLALAHETNENRMISWEMACLGLAQVYTAKYGERMTAKELKLHQGYKLVKESVNLARKLADNYLLGFVLVCWGECLRLEKKYDKAFYAYHESEKSLRLVGEQFFINMALINVANMAIHKKQIGTAVRCLRETFEIELKSNHKLMLAYSLTATAAVALERPATAKRAAVLHGAVEAMVEQLKIALQPTDKITYDNNAAILTRQLGKSDFAKLTAKGSFLTAEEIVIYALKTLESL